MRSSFSRQAHVCIPCQLRYGKRSFATTLTLASASRGPTTQTVVESIAQVRPVGKPSSSPIRRIKSNRNNNGTVRKISSGAGSKQSQEIQDTSLKESFDAPESIVLSVTQLNDVQTLSRLRSKLQSGVDKHTPEQNALSQGMLLEDALKLLKTTQKTSEDGKMLGKLEQLYRGQEISKALADLAVVSEHRRPTQKVVKEKRTRELLQKFGVISKTAKGRKRPAVVPRKILVTRASTALPSPARAAATAKKTQRGEAKAVQASAAVEQPQQTHTPTTTNGRDRRPTLARSESVIAELNAEEMKSLETRYLDFRPLEMGRSTVPGLSFDLARVLFNPGIYQLRDPRSRVFNFDPYLEHIMPVSEFDYEALNEYITASRDDALESLAKERRKKYVGSTSSMTSTLAHFHFLLSQWRPLNLQTLSKSFKTESENFTVLQRSPTSVFLRWKNGTYAVDADKEFETANVLMNLGKSMEKLFTLEQEDFERYRRSTQLVGDGKPQPDPEVYHYAEQGDFLMRSQLDAYDARLPGTGMFDLKTRAVVSIRMSGQKHEDGLGYQIKRRFGSWESYEREYYDMIRSTFLKYSLQVRMGRMDGIFVAYHNVERIFGFQYISLPEMDVHLHGQYDTSLGDQEFKLSLKLLNEVFDRAAARFPDRSLRFHFDTREASASERSPYMYIFAEAMDEADIDKIQTSRKGAVDAFNERVFNPPSEPVNVTQEGRQHQDINSAEPSLAERSDDADVDFLETVANEQEAASAAEFSSETTSALPGPILAMKLTIRNVINGQHVVRPEQILAEDVWTLEYTLVEMSEALGRRKYNVCRARRQSAFDASQQENDSTNQYLQRLKRMTEEGAAWRRQRDKADAQREVVVLYGDRPPGR